MMKILADENIPMAAELFGSLGEVRLMPGRSMRPEHLRGIDMLLVRSVTPVNEALLDGSPVKFVATATIGTDHLDIDYLESRGIAWAAAPGCNAEAVCDYVLSALLSIAARREVYFAELSLGVIGCGNVGGRVARRAHVLGVEVLENDPPLQRQTGDPRYRPLRDLYQADVLTLHTPLTPDGPDATHHLVEHRFLNRMASYACLINTSRGPVVDNAILKAFLRDSTANAILDVWENEPNIDPQLLDLVALGTPHIAGYSLDGKLRGTWMIHAAACQWLGREPQQTLAAFMHESAPPRTLHLDATGDSDDIAVGKAMLKVYSPEIDDALFRERLKTGGKSLAAVFDDCRKHYRPRREFSSTSVHITGATDGQIATLSALGFQVFPEVAKKGNRA